MTIKTRVIIVGGGPAGLVLAIELGRRNVPCVVIDQGTGSPSFPKANSTTSRTMEHYRRIGIVDRIRQIGLPDNYPPDISYHTRYAEHELARLHWPSREEALAKRLDESDKWPTPEPMHRGQQMFIEPILMDYASTFPSIELHYNTVATAVEADDNGATVRATHTPSGQEVVFEGAYVVGCDGPRSLVRSAMGVKYEGWAGEKRDFLGGRMMATFLNAPTFYTEGPRAPSWQYWCMNPERRGIMMAIDGKGLFAFHTQLAEGQEASPALAREWFDNLVGKELDYEVLGVAEWTAGFTLVAQTMQSGRMLLAGDAAHLFTPTAGLGYNTSVDDVANLGWKLAATINGWGGDKLLESYTLERKPIAERNTRFARSLAEYFRTIKLPPEIETDTPEGAKARADYGAELYDFAEREFAAPGIILGVFYGTSPINTLEDGPPPRDEPNFHEPSARPGARAPHVWMEDGKAVYDLFGKEFTLLQLSDTADTSAFVAAAAAQDTPLTVLSIDNARARDLYQADLVLIRPDQHVAWRGSTLAAPEAEAIVARARGAD
ncbi:FAD-dependent monooxygenase [Sphingobium fuliginis]|jgi:2-polyprenyl-6-methoxyphenol hydroxylase-like FAD-dependent oxidoreductase|uniref:FAD-dependent monooxygenase n=3 Tax=Sphingobium fuliginis (strain ATCC 27551) TaxID=336203 RepID=A0A7M2GPC7_SPHSA|nr:FAD-dependent monooxygenase [Sphingobium fuliginis]QDC39648.1 hypothetical protein FIL70_20880 [Sphingobium fuliginis ATCC 27551]QOT73952.1 FAD-dependent monooxygenase [Sphingobium fuliginis]